MLYSKFEIIFDTVPDADTVISIKDTIYNLVITETFKISRLTSNQVKLPAETSPGVYAGNVSENFKNAFVLDYFSGSSSIWTYSFTNATDGSGGGTFTVMAESNSNFVLLTNTSGAEIIITNVSGSVFEVDSLTYSQADTGACQNVKVNVETSTLATEIISPIVIHANTDNPFDFDLLRELNYVLKIQDAVGNIIIQNLRTPDLLNASNFNLTINNSPFGATVIVNNSHSNGLELQYSLDGSNWQDDNVFSGLDVDNYTLYVRDQLGCSFNQAFVINDNNIYSPVFPEISKSNAIRFAQRVTFGDAANYKTDENTLSCEVNDLLKYKEIQQFQTSDIVPTQFKSNYTTNTVTVIKPDGSMDNITVVQKSQNIGQKDKRDARKYDRGNGKTGIYFVSGNIYDYNTNAIIDTYSLLGQLPFWAQAGNYIQIGSAFFLIEQIIFDEGKNARVIEISNVYTGVETNIIAASIFNYFDYEIYEFYIDMLDYINSDIRVKVDATDPNFQTITYLSELINVKVRQTDTVEIHYWNDDNTDIFYATGIQFKIRIPITDVIGLAPDEFEINKTDTSVDLLSSELYEADQFVFEPVTKEMMRKINRALSHQNVYIDEVGYVKNESADVEKQSVSNAYVIKQNMIKTGNVFNGQYFGSNNAIYNGNAVNIPGIVKYNPGLVQY